MNSVKDIYFVDRKMADLVKFYVSRLPSSIAENFVGCCKMYHQDGANLAFCFKILDYLDKGERTSFIEKRLKRAGVTLSCESLSKSALLSLLSFNERGAEIGRLLDPEVNWDLAESKIKKNFESARAEDKKHRTKTSSIEAKSKLEFDYQTSKGELLEDLKFLDEMLLSPNATDKNLLEIIKERKAVLADIESISTTYSSKVSAIHSSIPEPVAS